MKKINYLFIISALYNAPTFSFTTSLRRFLVPFVTVACMSSIWKLGNVEAQKIFTSKDVKNKKANYLLHINDIRDEIQDEINQKEEHSDYPWDPIFSVTAIMDVTSLYTSLPPLFSCGAQIMKTAFEMKGFLQEFFLQITRMMFQK